MAAPISQSFYIAAAKAIRDERDRQVLVKGYGASRDAQYTDGELLKAGMVYLNVPADHPGPPPLTWPWPAEHFKPRDRKANLVRAGALFIADQDKRIAAGVEAGTAVDHLIEVTVAELAAELDRLSVEDIPDRWRLGNGKRWTRDDSVTFDVVGLAGMIELDIVTRAEHVGTIFERITRPGAKLLTVSDIAAWTDDQCRDAELWAGAIHLQASDNDDVEIPPTPEHLEPYLAHLKIGGAG